MLEASGKEFNYVFDDHVNSNMKTTIVKLLSVQLVENFTKLFRHE